jgi:hypothetical protein
MKMDVRHACLGVAAVVFTVVGIARAEEQPRDPPKEPKKLSVMQRKLTHSQRILEGLAKNEFDKIANGADGLIECINDATWKINDTEKYLMYSNDFKRRAENLKKAAKAKNIDSAALAYVDLTLTCVRCHQYLRGESD